MVLTDKLQAFRLFIPAPVDGFYSCHKTFKILKLCREFFMSGFVTTRAPSHKSCLIALLLANARFQGDFMEAETKNQ